jgi:CMP-N-acetylneuraminic acid synthetase
MNQKTIAIIPARAGSKRCPKKNIALFKGKTMVAHTIEQALGAKIFDKIIVSSDDPFVLEIASKYSVDIDKREAVLAKDSSTLLDVIRNLISKHNLHHLNIVGLLQVTAPLRNIDDILKAYNLFYNSSQDHAVVSVTFNESPVQLAWKIDNEHLISFFDKKKHSTRKQDYETTYRWNDAVICDLTKNFLNPDRTLFGKSPIPYIMPPERSINIDYEFQLKLVQLMEKYYE